MSRNSLFVVIAIAALVAAFLIVVPLARHLAAQQLGWNEAGQNALAKFLFFPFLIVFLYVLKWRGARRQNQEPGAD